MSRTGLLQEVRTRMHGQDSRRQAAWIENPGARAAIFRDLMRPGSNPFWFARTALRGTKGNYGRIK